VKKWPAFRRTAALVTCALILVSCAGLKSRMSDAEVWSKFEGAWVNTDYSGHQPWVQKMVFKPGLLGEDWTWASDSAAAATWEAAIKKYWVDDAGSMYCQMHWRYRDKNLAGAEGAGLLRVDRLGKTLELNSVLGAPAEGKGADWAYSMLRQIDPDLRTKLGESGIYFIYYRE
jgi:hypothetical protein